MVDLVADCIQSKDTLRNFQKHNNITICRIPIGRKGKE